MSSDADLLDLFGLPASRRSAVGARHVLPWIIIEPAGMLVDCVVISVVSEVPSGAGVAGVSPPSQENSPHDQQSCYFPKW